MKTIGLIGGMSWESTQLYYRLFNELVKEKVGAYHSCKCLILSVDFGEIAPLQRQGRWKELGEQMAQAARQLEKGGAGLILIGANTMHLLADAVEEAVDIPLLHIADATGQAIREMGLERIGLLGTRYTMEMPFYKDRLATNFSIETLIPADDERTFINQVIYEELTLGVIKESSRTRFLDIIGNIYRKGAQGVVLGCTEIPMLIGQEHTDMPVFDTTAIHAEAAVDWAIQNMDTAP